MTAALADAFGVGPSELIAFIGAGGKTTLMLRLAAELVDRGQRVVVTTTTKMGHDQVPTGAIVCRPNPGDAAAALERSRLVMAVAAPDGHKVTGPAVTDAARLLSETSADHLLVEADGARSLPLKAPGLHEPVIPPETSLVVVCAGLDAIGRTWTDGCHRPHRGAALAGRDPADPIGVVDVATIVGHPEGGLARIPETARIVVALTKADPDSPDAAAAAALLAANDRIDRVIVIPAAPPPAGRPGRSSAA